MKKATILKIKVAGTSYTACFYDSTFGQIKPLKCNEAIDVEEEYADCWCIRFANKGKDKDVYPTVVVLMEKDEHNNRTDYIMHAEFCDADNESDFYCNEVAINVINA